MQGERQFDDAEVRSQVSPGGSDLVDQELADLGGQIAELLLGQVLQIGGSADLFEHPVSLRSTPRMVPPAIPGLIMGLSRSHL